MEVILLQKVTNLGNIGDRVNVKSGYGRNFLLPKGKATLATADNVAKFEARRSELEKQAREELAAAQARAAKLEGFKLSMTAKAGNEGKLFGSVGNTDIIEALAKGIVMAVVVGWLVYPLFPEDPVAGRKKDAPGGLPAEQARWIAARSAALDCATITRRSSPRTPAARQNAPCRSTDRGCPSGKP